MKLYKQRLRRNNFLVIYFCIVAIKHSILGKRSDTSFYVTIAIATTNKCLWVNKNFSLSLSLCCDEWWVWLKELLQCSIILLCNTHGEFYYYYYNNLLAHFFFFFFLGHSSFFQSPRTYIFIYARIFIIDFLPIKLIQ